MLDSHKKMLSWDIFGHTSDALTLEVVYDLDDSAFGR